ncbi:MAG TPA: hypothetical protein PLM20_05940 [Syntrophomonadaceae bacterium]|nr:hypothetical protein [Syntrophomonadaceae bacterium]
MAHEEEEKKRIYDETASLITRQAVMNKLTSEELHFLLNLLDHVVITNQQRPIIDILHRWIKISVEKEINDTIKNVLLNTDFDDETQVAASIQFIEELLCTNNEEP